MKEKNYDIGCFWIDNLECPIKREFQNRKIISQTIKQDEGIGGLMAGMMQQIPLDLQVLPAFCNMCPLLKSKVKK